jgi:hypothetical protein
MNKSPPSFKLAGKSSNKGTPSYAYSFDKYREFLRKQEEPDKYMIWNNLRHLSLKNPPSYNELFNYYK